MKSFTIISPTSLPSGQVKNLPASRDRHPFVEINPDDITKGEMTPADHARLLKSFQDNVRAATEPFRTNPLLGGEIHTVTVKPNQLLVIPHGLGEPYGYWWQVDALGAPATFARVPPTATQPANKYLLLIAGSTASGSYSFVITPK